MKRLTSRSMAHSVERANVEGRCRPLSPSPSIVSLGTSQPSPCAAKLLARSLTPPLAPSRETRVYLGLQGPLFTALPCPRPFLPPSTCPHLAPPPSRLRLRAGVSYLFPNTCTCSLDDLKIHATKRQVTWKRDHLLRKPHYFVIRNNSEHAREPAMARDFCGKMR